jgi:hypothetical protein
LIAVLERHRTSADLWFGLLGASLIACAVAFAVLGPLPLPPAPMVLIGIPSPLTGMTRSFVALAGGHLGTAFAFHPLGPLTFVACIVAVVNLSAMFRTGRRLAIVDALVSKRYTWALIALAFGVVWLRQIAVYS